MISENMLLYISGEYGKPNVINPKIQNNKLLDKISVG